MSDPLSHPDFVSIEREVNGNLVIARDYESGADYLIYLTKYKLTTHTYNGRLIYKKKSCDREFER